MSTKETVLIRTDADGEIGVGHVMRCLAFTQAWRQEGGKCFFAMTSIPSMLDDRLSRDGLKVTDIQSRQRADAEDAENTVEIAREIGAEWIVVDGYHFDSNYLKTITDAGLNMLLITDLAFEEHCPANIILNPNPHGKESMYPNRKPGAVLLLGTKYAMIRQEFLAYKTWQRQFKPRARQILVTMGGGETSDALLRTVKVLESSTEENWLARIVLGPANKASSEIEHICKSNPTKLQLERNVADMSELLAWADLAITGGGSTCWELAFMGLPALTIVLAENQRPIAQALAKAGVVENLGWHSEASAELIDHHLKLIIKNSQKREAMSKKGRTMIDGQGSSRVVKAITEYKS